EGEGAAVACVPCLVADAVAVVEDLGALVLELDHRLHLGGHGLPGLLREAVGVPFGLLLPVLERDLAGQVAQRVVALVWSVTTSTSISPARWRRSSSGKMLAALPTSPTERARRSRFAAVTRASASSRS